MRLESYFRQFEIPFEENVPLASYTTFRVGGPADFFLKPRNQKELIKILPLLEEEGRSFFVLGGGSNLLVRDGGVRGVVLSLAGLDKFYLDQGLLVAEAGVFLPRLLTFCLEKGLSGLEFLAGVPATVGGAVAMNAGAFGQEMKDILAGVFLYQEGEIRYFLREELDFAYRCFFLPAGSLVVAAAFRLRPTSPAEVKHKLSRFLAERKKRQPLSRASAGSIFKNPPQAPAGFLIEAAGLKGFRRGGAQISPKHANFIVNVGGARAQDVLALMDLARERVFREFGVLLEEEVRVVGEG